MLYIYSHDFHHYWDSVLSEKRSLLTNIVFVIQIWSEWNKRMFCFKNQCASSWHIIKIGDVSLSIALSWKTIEGFISFGGWSIFITKVALQIYELSVYAAVMFSVVQNQAQVVIALDRTSALSGNTQTSTQQRTNTGFCNIKKHPISRLSSPFHYFKRSLFQAPR